MEAHGPVEGGGGREEGDRARGREEEEEAVDDRGPMRTSQYAWEQVVES